MVGELDGGGFQPHLGDLAVNFSWLTAGIISDGSATAAAAAADGP